MQSKLDFFVNEILHNFVTSCFVFYCNKQRNAWSCTSSYYLNCALEILFVFINSCSFFPDIFVVLFLFFSDDYDIIHICVCRLSFTNQIIVIFYVAKIFMLHVNTFTNVNLPCKKEVCALFDYKHILYST